MSEVLHITKNDFDSLVLQAEGKVLVDFWAEWCGPCRMMSPILEQLAGERSDVTIAKVNVDEEPELAAQYQIMSIPALKLFNNGQVVAEQIGAVPKAVLVDFLERS